MKVNELNAVTTSRDIIQSLLNDDEQVAQVLLTIGCAGWQAGQLERELAENSWLTVEADNEILFEMPAEARYQAALQKLGVNQVNLMAGVGYA